MSTAFDRKAGTALLIIQGFNDEDVVTFLDFCEAAADRFHGLKAQKASFSEQCVEHVESWLEQAKIVIEERETSDG